MSKCHAITCVGWWLVLLCFMAPSQAQLPTTKPAELRVFLATFGPGDDVYERWGHNILIIENPQVQRKVAYHYGLFDFNQPNFIGRFVRGRMLYSMGAIPSEYVDPVVQGYVDEDRDVWMQELNLSQPQVHRLLDYFEVNYQPENREYLYEYYRANCSTKLRDAIDHALGGQLRNQWAGLWTDNSYRRYTRIGGSGNFFIYTGLSLAMSSSLDRPMSVWQEAFVPMILREQLGRVIIAGSPLVKTEQVLHVSQHLRLPYRPPMWIPIYLAIGLFIGGAMLMCGMRFHRTRWSDRALRFLMFTWSLVCGLAGLFLLFIWCFTNHVSAHANQNLLLFSPLSFAMMVLASAAVKGKPRGRLALPLARVIVLLAIGSLVLKILPVSRQHNWEMFALAMPVHLGMMFALTVPRNKSVLETDAKQALQTGV